MRGRDAAILQTSSDGTRSNYLVLIKSIKSMAKLFSEGIVIMYDVKENVEAAYAAMQAAGSNVIMQED